MRTALRVLLAFCALLSSITLHATVLSFEGFSDSTLLTTQYGGVTFTNTIILTSGISLDEFEFPPTSGVNVASDSGGPITIAFASPVMFVGGYFTYDELLTLQAFGSQGQSLGSAVSPFSNNLALSGNPGSAPDEFLSLSSSAGISQLVIAGDPYGGSFTLDDFTYTDSSQPAPPSPSPVPEPPSLTLLILGACLGAAVVGRNRFSHTRLLPAAGLVFLLCSSGRALCATAPSIATIQAQPTSIFVATPSLVTVTATVPGTNLIPGSVNLVRYNSNGTALQVVGQMYDDGSHGDTTAGDGIYTGQVSLNEAAETAVYMRVSAAYRGVLARSLSPYTEVDAVHPISATDSQAVFTTISAADSYYSTLLNQGSSLSSAQSATVTWLNAQASVYQAGASDDNGFGIWILYKSGILGGMFLSPSGLRGGGTALPSHSAVAYSKLRRARALLAAASPATTPTTGIGSRTAILLDPFASEFTSTDESAVINVLLQNDGISVGQYFQNESANVNSFKGLNGYGVVSIVSHGDTWFGGLTWPGTMFPLLCHDDHNPGNSVSTFFPPTCTAVPDAEGTLTFFMKPQVVLFTGQPIGQADLPNLDKVTVDDLLSERLVIGYRHDTKDFKLAVTPNFIGFYNPHFAGSIVYVGTCRSYFVDANNSTNVNSTMSDAFLGNGAGTFFGYTEYVPWNFAFFEGRSIFQTLTTGGNTGDAYDYVENDSQSTSGTGTVRVFMAGNPNVYLKACTNCLTFTFPNGIATNQQVLLYYYGPSIIPIQPLILTNLNPGDSVSLGADPYYPTQESEALHLLVLATGPGSVEYQLTLPAPFVFPIDTPGVTGYNQTFLDYTFPVNGGGAFVFPYVPAQGNQ